MPPIAHPAPLTVRRSAALCALAWPLLSLAQTPPEVRSLVPHTGVQRHQCYGDGASALLRCNRPEVLTLSGKHAQDGMRAAVNPMRYSAPAKAGGGHHDRSTCVQDDVTGLIWEGKTDDGGPRDYRLKYSNWGDGRAGDASAYVAQVNAMALCGHADWRLPSATELQGLVHYGIASKATRIDREWFAHTLKGAYWSGTAVAPVATDLMWFVSFRDGAVRLNRPGYTRPVRLVRGPGHGATPRFEPSADGGVVTDHQTGLVWRRCAEGMVWVGASCSGTPLSAALDDALRHAATQRGWRLPNAKELGSLVDRTRAFPAIDGDAFPATPPGGFWSSTPLTYEPGFAWQVNFGPGDVDYNAKGQAYHLRLVRMRP